MAVASHVGRGAPGSARAHAGGRPRHGQGQRGRGDEASAVHHAQPAEDDERGSSHVRAEGRDSPGGGVHQPEEPVPTGANSHALAVGFHAAGPLHYVHTSLASSPFECTFYRSNRVKSHLRNIHTLNAPSVEPAPPPRAYASPT